MTYTDETLSAFIDGELPADELTAIAEALKTDPALAARVAQLKAPDALIANAYAAIDDEPMPDAVLAMLAGAGAATPDRTGDNVVQFAAKPAAMRARPWLAPLAASVALAIGVGLGMQIADGARDAVAAAGLIGPEHPVFAAIESAPSGTTVNTALGAVTPVLTFVSADNHFCREYSLRGDGQFSRAVACKTDNGWQTAFAAFGVASGDGAGRYSTASAIDEARFAALVSDLMAQDALSPEDEATLLDRWER